MLLLTVLSFGCSNQTNNVEKVTKTATTIGYPIQPLFVDNGEEGWGGDIRLSITEITSIDSFIAYKAVSYFEGKKVGIEFILPNGKAGIDNSPTQILEVKTCGESSDNLLLLLSKLYKLKIDTTKHFIKSAQLAFVDLNEFAKAKFGKDAISHTDAKEMKLFFETVDPGDYAELYVNVNEKEHWLELREKDENYRKQVIKFFAGE
jgi:hypothetical protein